MSIPVEVGSLIPLSLHLSCYDGHTVYYVKAKLLNQDGSLYLTKNLTNNGNGVFIDNSLGMPDKEVLTAIYTTYADDLYTELTEYCDAVDMFTKADKVTINKVDRTEIFLSKANNTSISTSSTNAKIEMVQDKNIIIEVSDEDAIIDTDGNNTTLEV